MKKKIIAIVLAVVTLFSSLFSLAGCTKTKSELSMGEWLYYIANYFGMESYINETPFFANVPQNDEFFAYFQMAAEWEILTPNGDVTSSTPVKWKDALVQTVNACGAMENEAEDEDKINYAISTFDNSIRKYWMNRCIKTEDALVLLANAQNFWANRKYAESVEKIELSDNVKDLAKSSFQKLDDSTILINSNDNLNVGDIVCVNDSNGEEEKEYRRIESLSDSENGRVVTTSSDLELEDVYKEISITDTVSPTLANTVIYSGDGTLAYSGGQVPTNVNDTGDVKIDNLVYSPNNNYKSDNCLDGSFSQTFKMSGYEISYSLDNSGKLGVTVKSKAELDENGKKNLEASLGFEVSDINITKDFDWSLFGGLKSAMLKVDYQTKSSFGIKYTAKSEKVAAPEYSNGNGKFLTNFKRAIIKDSKASGAKTVASKKTIPICKLNIYSAGIAKVCLDVRLVFSAEGSISISLTENGSKGVEYKNKNVRFIKVTNKSVDGEIKAKLEATVGFGPALYVIGLKKKLVGIEVQVGAGVVASLKGHLADFQMHLIEEADFNEFSPEDLSSILSSDLGISANVGDIKAIAESRGGVFETNLLDVPLHIDTCLDISLYIILKLGVTDESYLVDFVGDKVNLSVDILNEKNCKLINYHVDNFDFKNGVLSLTSDASEDHCTLKYVPFDSATDETVANEDITERNDSVTVGEVLTMSTMNINLDEGQEYLISITQLPKGYTIDDIIYKTKDSKVASVNSQGVIHASQSGSTIVYAETKDGKYKAFASVIVQTSVTNAILT